MTNTRMTIADIGALQTLEVLETGALIKMRRTLPYRPGTTGAEIVLAHLPWNKVTPLVTWQKNMGVTDGCYWGHYFQPADVDAAIDDFQTRGR